MYPIDASFSAEHREALSECFYEQYPGQFQKRVMLVQELGHYVKSLKILGFFRGFFFQWIVLKLCDKVSIDETSSECFS